MNPLPFLVTIYRSRWFRSGLIVLLLMVLVWYAGPLLGLGALHPLETELARYVTIGVLFALWIIHNLTHQLRVHRRDKELANGIAQGTPEEQSAAARLKETEKASAEEVAVLQDRLQKAMQALRKSKLGRSRKRLSTMPWYMIIGPPGAGKTTALQNCGLRFPLETGRQPVAGVGGTRNCEWLFTDEAVLIDTAGRYTTQDSAADVDSTGWLGFLDMLKKHRKRQPMNGALVAISLSDLASQTEAERQAHARAIRHRVRELHERLNVRVPIYVLFTKADLIAGFTEFFDNMGREERDQVWGMTFPMDDGTEEEGVVAAFRAEFDLLVGRLNDRMLERVHQEPDIRRRRLIYGFPQQVASLRDVAAEFLTDAFRPSRLEARPLLRGVYMTSGTQDGTPIDRLLGTMAAEFGLPRQAAAAASGPDRSYFLSRLLREVIFGEAALAGLDPRIERRRKLVSIGAYAACGLALLGLAGSWLNSYIGNRELIAQVHAGASSYNALLGELQRRGADDQDLAATVPPLNALRGIRAGYNERDVSPSVNLTFGLYQGTKLSSAATEAYRKALNNVLLPRLLTLAEKQVAANLDKPDILYQTLKVYLILSRQGRLDGELIKQWLQAYLLATYPGEEDEANRKALLDHVAVMLEEPLRAIPMNLPLVAQARAVLTKQPLAEYSYNRVLRSKTVQGLPPWTVVDEGGPEANRVFELRSGKDLNQGIPGVYTWPGYHTAIIPLVATVTEDISEDSWVLGHEKRDVQATLRDTAKLRRDVLGLYFNDFTRRWDAMLADIALKLYTTPLQALDQLSRLGSPNSPLRDLLESVDWQTQLSRPSVTKGAADSAGGMAARMMSRTRGVVAYEARVGLSLRQLELTKILAEAFGTDLSGKPVDPARRVDDHFRLLHSFVAGESNRPAPLEVAIQRIQTLYRSFNVAAATPGGVAEFTKEIGNLATLAPAPGGNGGTGGGGTGGAAPPAGSDSAITGGAAVQLQELMRSPSPEATRIISPVATNLIALVKGNAGQELLSAWRSSQGGRLCEDMSKHYPFVSGSADDVPIEDFTRLLGPGGEMEKFFNVNLKAYVDTTRQPWRLIAKDHAPSGVTDDTLKQFERAAQIREDLFNNGPTVQVRFQLTPVDMGGALGQVSVEIGDKTLTYANGPLQTQPFTWPGADGKYGVRLTMTPTAPDGVAAITEKDGPWALLRLLEGHANLGAQTNKFRVSFEGGGGTVKFQLTANSTRSLFTLSALRSFGCPKL